MRATELLRELLDRPLGELVGAFPEFGWRGRHGRYVAGDDEHTHAALGVRAGRVEAKAGPDGRCRGPVVHGHDGAGVPGAKPVRGGCYLPWLHLAWGREPDPGAFPAAVAALAARLGVDASCLDRPMTEEDRRRWREGLQERRRAAAERLEAERKAREADERDRVAAAGAVWDACQAARDDAVARVYLAGRLGLDPGRDMPAAVCGVADGARVVVRYPGRRAWTARGPMLAARVRTPGRVVSAVQLLRLARDGEQLAKGAWGEAGAKLTYGVLEDEQGGGWVELGVVPGGDPGVLVLGEGLETTLAAAWAAGGRGAACLSTGGLAAVEPVGLLVDGVARVQIAADHDEPGPAGRRPGWEAAVGCGERWRAHGLGVTVHGAEDER